MEPASQEQADAVPALGTIERWAWDYVTSTSLAAKIAPPPVPARWEHAARAVRVVGPGRPAELEVVAKAKRVRALGSPTNRAKALHTFWHHELQAAELMLWALLAFPETPEEFRRGLVRIALDEIRHMKMYETEILRLGHRIGAFVVRDWFWERIPAVTSPAAFVAVMGLGVESANLEHTVSYAARFREVGDEEGARIQEIVGREEIAHAAFAARWFATFTGGISFDSWRAHLPPPLTPLLMRGRPLHRDARTRAGQPAAFLDALDAWEPEWPLTMRRPDATPGS